MIDGNAEQGRGRNRRDRPGAAHATMSATPATQPLKLYTLYGPPEHKDGIVQSTKAQAEARHAQ